MAVSGKKRPKMTKTNAVYLEPTINCVTLPSEKSLGKLTAPPPGATRNHYEKFQKSRQLLQEITATSSGNHGNFFRKSRQLL
jgi:hypothetical protein